MVDIPAGYAHLTHVLDGPGPEARSVTLGVRNDTGVDTVTSVGSVVSNAVSLTWPSGVTGIMASISNTYTLTKVNVLYRDAALDLFSLDLPFALGGGTTDPPASPNWSFLVQKLTAKAGKRHRGRMYMPGIGETSVDNEGQISQILADAQADRWNDYRDALAVNPTVPGADCPPVILHSTPVGIGGLPTEITAFAVPRLGATQRRRLR